MPLPAPFGGLLLSARYALRVEPLLSEEEVALVASRTVRLWEQQGEFEQPCYLGDAAIRHGSYHVTWTEGVRRPLAREVLWRVGRLDDTLVWSSLDGLGRGRTPHWLKEALSRLLGDINAGLRERDLSCLPPAPDRRQAWRQLFGVGAVRSLRLDDFDPDGGPEGGDVVHLRDLPELLWLAAGSPGVAMVESHQGFLDLARGLFEVLGETEHWLYRALPERLESREQIVEAVASSDSSRDARTLRELWQWRDRLMEPARPWGGIMMCRHPVLRGRDGRTWEGWDVGDGELSDLLADLGGDIARSVLDNIDVARRIGEAMVGLWQLGVVVDEPVAVGEAREAAAAP